MSFSEAHELVNLAHEKGLSLSAAPSRLLGETAQTMWKALRQKMIGKIHLAYAEMDGGLIHRAPYKNGLTSWTSRGVQRRVRSWMHFRARSITQ